VSQVPCLRYLGLYGLISVSGRSITKAVAAGTCVGTVPDGIAGIFRCTEDDEVVVLRKRKGLAKLALRTGAPILPAYSIGNTAAYGAWFDRWGVLERISRKLQASFFLYWGRLYLPVPRRVNVTMLIGAPILVQQVDEPTAEQIDAVHDRLLSEMKTLFDTHKDALGWGHKKIIFE
jgi:2-acylglycerol O-acyltransferase 2